MKIQKVLSFIDKQIRCYDRKIANITKLKKEEKRCLTEKERREIKFLVGRKEECKRIKSYIEINSLVENQNIKE